MKKFLLFIFCFLLQLTVSSQNKLNPNIPDAFFSRQSPGFNSDSILFKIYIKNDSIQLSSVLGIKPIDNFIQLDDYYCKIVKYKSSRSENYFYDPYYVLLYIDSATSYRKTDELFEELRTLEQDKIFLSTNVRRKQNQGFYIDLIINNDNTQNIVKSLYGDNYHKKKYMYLCIKTNPKNNVPPPPPLVFENPYSMDVYLEMKKNGIDSNFYFIGIDSGKLIVNQKPSDINYIAELILKRDAKLYLKLTEKNVYNDLIKLIDILYTGREIAFKKAGKIMFNKKYNDLTSEEYGEIYRKYHLYFKILSLSDQIYLEKNTK